MLSNMPTSKIISCIICFIILFTLPYNVSSKLPPDPYNITEILELEPDLSEFTNYLIQTLLINIINTNWENEITILGLTNSAMLSLLSNISTSGMSPLGPLPFRSVMRAILSLHIIPHYYDDGTLHGMENSSVITTFYSRTYYGDQISEVTTVNYNEGGVGFVSTVPGSISVKLVKEIRTISYNVSHMNPLKISVLQVSSPIMFPALLINITIELEKAGFNTFAQLLSETTTNPYNPYSSEVIASYYFLLRSDSGITIFAPSDEALKAVDFSKIDNAHVEKMLQLHALDFYAPIETLQNYKEHFQVRTFHSGYYNLSFLSRDNVVTLHTGLVDANITATLFDIPRLLIYGVDQFLLPQEYFYVNPPPPPLPSPLPPPPHSLTPPPPYPSPPLPPTPAPTPVSGGGGRKMGCVNANVWWLMVALLYTVNYLSLINSAMSSLLLNTS